MQGVRARLVLRMLGGCRGGRGELGLSQHVACEALSNAGSDGVGAWGLLAQGKPSFQSTMLLHAYSANATHPAMPTRPPLHAGTLDAETFEVPPWPLQLSIAGANVVITDRVGAFGGLGV
jgi:hypothetical protein